MPKNVTENPSVCSCLEVSIVSKVSIVRITLKPVNFTNSRKDQIFSILFLVNVGGFVGTFFISRTKFSDTVNSIFLALFLQTQIKNNKNNFESKSFNIFGEILWN